eukprot:scaffold60829_cov15-Tisochrysis_lutea.AAC.1
MPRAREAGCIGGLAWERGHGLQARAVQGENLARKIEDPGHARLHTHTSTRAHPPLKGESLTHALALLTLLKVAPTCVAGYQRLLSARLQQLLGSVPRRRQGCRQGRKFAARATSPAH